MGIHSRAIVPIPFTPIALSQPSSTIPQGATASWPVIGEATDGEVKEFRDQTKCRRESASYVLKHKSIATIATPDHTVAAVSEGYHDFGVGADYWQIYKAGQDLALVTTNNITSYQQSSVYLHHPADKWAGLAEELD